MTSWPHFWFAMVVAFAWGFVWPRQTTLLGTVLIVCSGSFIGMCAYEAARLVWP